jgi:hypothetical protein
MVKNWGAVFVFVGFITAGLLVALFTTPTWHRFVVWTDTNHDVIEALSALGAFIFTAVLAISTYFLWSATKGAAERQETITRILQRAYLSAIPRGIHKMTDGTYIAHVAFQNVGNLPARHVRNQVYIKWFNDGDKRNFDPVPMTEPGAIMLSPKIEVERGTGAMSAEAVAKYEAKEGFIFVWGRLEYEDGFEYVEGLEQPRWLDFCHRYNCAKPEVLRHHHHHNNGN